LTRLEVPKLLWKTAGVVNSQYDVIIKILVPLLKDLGFADAEMEFEKPLAGQLILQIGSKKISVKRPDIFVKVGERPVMVVEAKSPDETISTDAIGQAVSYAVMFGTPFALVSNGQIMELFKVDSLLSYQQVENVLTKKEFEEAITPKFGVAEKEEAKRSLITFKEKKEFANVFNTCHDIIRTQKGLGAKERLYEMCKILFVKLNEEIRYYKEKEENRFTLKLLDEMSNKGIDALTFFNESLFKNVKERLSGTFDEEKVSIFAENEGVELESSTIRDLVSELEKYTLFQTGEDIIGVAFETFLRGTMTGKELGEFFTPREIVDFIVDVADPNVGDTVCDPACGSGGFLIRAFQKIAGKIEKMPVDENKKQPYRDDLVNKCLWGVDIDRSLVKLAQANLVLHGDGFAHIYQHNSLIAPELDNLVKNQKFNLILTNPPFGRGKGKDVTDKKILNHYVLGRNRKKQSPQILFLERCINLLNEDSGRLFIVIDDGILSNSTLGYVREYITQTCVINGVVSLPRGAFNPYGSGVKSSILILRKKKTGEHQQQVFMADIKFVGYDTRRRTRYVQLDRDDLKPLRGSYKSASPMQEPLAWLVSAEHLENQLNCDYYHPEYLSIIEDMEKKAKTGLYEIVKLGQRDLLEVSAMLGFERETFKYSSSGTIPYIRVHNIEPFHIDLHRGVVYIEENVHKRLQRSSLKPKDVVLTITGTVGVAAVVPDSLKEANISQEIVRIRIKNMVRLNPHYLVAYLNRAEARLLLQRWSSGGTRPRTLIRQVRKIPFLIPKDTQLQEEAATRVREIENAYITLASKFEELASFTERE